MAQEYHHADRTYSTLRARQLPYLSHPLSQLLDISSEYSPAFFVLILWWSLFYEFIMIVPEKTGKLLFSTWRYNYRLKRTTISEHTHFHTLHTARNRNRNKASTKSESPISNTCHRIRNRYWGEANASPESICSNTCHRIRNRDWGEVTASQESICSNTFHRIRNLDWGEATAIIVFRSDWLPIICS